MECKSVQQTVSFFLPHGINRNIVECKFGWRMRIHGDGSRINRNIVECKWQLAAKINRILRQELIETLWNVNVEIVEARLFNSWN